MENNMINMHPEFGVFLFQFHNLFIFCFKVFKNSVKFGIQMYDSYFFTDPIAAETAIEMISSMSPSSRTRVCRFRVNKLLQFGSHDYHSLL